MHPPSRPLSESNGASPEPWVPTMHFYAPLAAIAAGTFLIFERSRGGLFMMALLFVIGPVVEIGLINQVGLYEYTHPDFMGIPSWICWVYAAGGPANGALGRQVLSMLEDASRDE